MKSPTEFVELSTKHARKQFEAMTAQTRELAELAVKVTTEITVKDWRHGDGKASSKVADLEAEGVVERLGYRRRTYVDFIFRSRRRLCNFLNVAVAVLMNVKPAKV